MKMNRPLGVLFANYKCNIKCTFKDIINFTGIYVITKSRSHITKLHLQRTILFVLKLKRTFNNL